MKESAKGRFFENYSGVEIFLNFHTDIQDSRMNPPRADLVKSESRKRRKNHLENQRKVSKWKEKMQWQAIKC